MTIAKYSFLPWLRQGISNKINELDNLGAAPISGMAKERPEITVRLKLNQNQIRKNIKLHGPGDVIGINRDAILREYPKAGTTDFESNVLAYVEFYEEDFPWRYTPAIRSSVTTRLRPWLALIVAKEGEYSFNVYGNGLPVVSINSAHAAKVFPNHQQSWAWAHVHINKTMSNTNLETNLKSQLDTDPDIAYSRLLCPRKLERAEGGIKYHAFLVPAFETGRLAGLGEDPGEIFAQQSSWISNGQSGSNIRPFDYPVYYNWEFQTGEFGDFETLVSILKARPAGDRFGKRDMSIQAPGMGLDGMANTNTLGIEGALRPPGFESDQFPNGPGDDDFVNKLKDILNVSDDLQNETAKNDPINPYFNNSNVFYSEKIADDPIITPPLYAKWQALKKRLTPGVTNKQWFHELNADPRNRATAAIGTQVVMNNQEKYMESAWKQVGEINEANQKIREAELAKMVNNSIYEKRLSKMDDDKLLMVTSPAQKYILNPGADMTFEQSITESKIPNAAKSAAFKKIIRPGKKSLKKIGKLGEEEGFNVQVHSSILTRFNGKNMENPLTAAKRKKEPAMVVPTSTVENAIKFFLDLQENEVAIEEDESLILDEETISTQLEYSNSFSAFSTKINALSLPQEKASIANISNFSHSLFTQMNPLVTIPFLMRSFIVSGDGAMEEIKPIMAYPEFKEPMFAELKKISQDFIIPNFSEIPENTITLLNNNQVFIEAFMAGLNNEMSRELLWREYPTDQRGSYFRNFWDDKDSFESGGEHSDHDITEIHSWTGELGTHNERIINAAGLPEDKKNFVVLVIRGDLLKKYPNTVVYAHKAEFQNDHNSPRIILDIKDQTQMKTPIFQGELEPDVALYGFSLTEAEVRGNDSDAGWFFVLKERPGQINFGLDDFVDENANDGQITIPQQNASSWNNLSWGHLVPANSNLNNYHSIDISYVRADTVQGEPVWGFNSAHMASILYQNPMIIARHGEEMLPPV